MKKSAWSILLTATFLLTLIPGGVQAQAHKTGAITDQAAYEKVPYKSNLVRGALERLDVHRTGGLPKQDPVPAISGQQ
jgi:hypothetical protein